MFNVRYLLAMSVFMLVTLGIGSAPAFGVEKSEIIACFAHESPKQWGLGGIDGILSRLGDGSGKAIALTFDACGGGKSLVDSELIDFFEKNNIPATLFINARWIARHKKEFLALAANPLFEIGNHGTRHIPLSVTGRSAYGIQGTRNIGEVYDEVMSNQKIILELTGKAPRFFRSGTAHYDDVSVRALQAMGLRIVGFTINADHGATLNPEQVKRQLLSARGGEIVIAHFNHPGHGTAAGIKQAIPLLLERGFRFVTLSELYAGPQSH